MIGRDKSLGNIRLYYNTLQDSTIIPNSAVPFTENVPSTKVEK